MSKENKEEIMFWIGIVAMYGLVLTSMGLLVQCSQTR